MTERPTKRGALDHPRPPDPAPPDARLLRVLARMARALLDAGAGGDGAVSTAMATTARPAEETAGQAPPEPEGGAA